MNWKTCIKNVLPWLPFVTTDRYHIVELRRTQCHTVTETNISTCYRKALCETDFLDITDAFPEELNRTEITDRIKKRFQDEIPCFVARNKVTNELIGAVWLNPQGHSFLQEHAAQPVYWVTNLFIRSKFQGNGMGKQLLIVAVQTLFQETRCEAVLSQIHIKRISSLQIHAHAGFQIIGEYRESHIGNYWFGEFKRIINHKMQ